MHPDPISPGVSQLSDPREALRTVHREQRRERNRRVLLYENSGKLIVTIACSTCERYLSTALADKTRAAVGA